MDDFLLVGGRGLMVFRGSGASISRSQQRIKGERDSANELPIREDHENIKRPRLMGRSINFFK